MCRPAWSPWHPLILKALEQTRRIIPIVCPVLQNTVGLDTSPETAPIGHLPRVKCQVQNGAMKYGYARVSTDDQNPSLQLAALKKAGCQIVFRDEGISGA